MRIGLIAEGEAELGSSIPYIKPEAGGKPIERFHRMQRHRAAFPPRFQTPIWQF